MKRNIIDLHCDTITCHMDDDTFTLQDNSRNISEEKLKKGGAMAQCFALFIPLKDGPDEETCIDDCYRRFLLAYDFYKKDMMRNNSWLREAFSVSDLLNNREAGVISSILTLEDGTFIGDHMNRLEEAYDKGARALALTWNTENRIGYPNSAIPKNHMLGLKPFGFEVVERMNELGMIVDVSHLSEGGFYDVAEISKKPFIATHSCCRALCDHPRNLKDEQLRIIGNAGGIVGINFYPPFIKKDSMEATNAMIAAHIRHIADVAGTGAIALGSDFDGMGTKITLELKDYAGYPSLLHDLERIFTDSELDQLMYKNALRVFKEVW